MNLFIIIWGHIRNANVVETSKNEENLERSLEITSKKSSKQEDNKNSFLKSILLQNVSFVFDFSETLSHEDMDELKR